MARERLHYIDIAKGIGIILVVLSHTRPTFNEFIYLFHVPLFFFLSGMFHREKDEYHPVEAIKKKIKTLYFPYIRYGLFFLITFNISYSIGLIGSELTGLREFWGRLFKLLAGWEMYYPPLFPLWFLPCLLFSSVLFILIRYSLQKLQPKFKEPVTALTVVISLVLGMNLYVDWNISRTLLAIPFYYLGFLFFKYKEYIKYNAVFALVAFALVAWCSTFQQVNFFGNSFTDPVFFVPVSLLGIYTVLFFSYKIRKSQMLEYIGKHTIVILALHLLSFKLVNLIRIWSSDLPEDSLGYFFAPTEQKLYWCIIYTVVGVGLPLLLQYLGNKIKLRVVSLLPKKKG